MNKFLLCLKYKLGMHLPWIGFWIAIYLVIMGVVTYALVTTAVINANSGSLVYRIWAGLFFLVSVTMRFKEDFNFLISLSNTRTAIFQSSLVLGIGLSFILSLLMVLEKVVIDHLNHLLGYTTIVDPFHFIAPYRTDSLFLSVIFFFSLVCFCVMFGLLMGSLFYRFGKRFTIFFWLVFSAIPIIIFPMLSWLFYLIGDLGGSINAASDFFMHFDLLAGSGNLSVLTLVFIAAAYMNIRNLPQK